MLEASREGQPMNIEQAERRVWQQPLRYPGKRNRGRMVAADWTASHRGDGRIIFRTRR
jgi:hypothetical protein